MIQFIGISIFLVGFLTLGHPIVMSQRKLAKEDPERQREESLKIVQKVLRVIFRMTGSELVIIGQEHIPDDRPVLFVGNHRSYFDIIAAYLAVKRPMGFVAKKEMKNYKLLDGWMELLHCVLLDRKDIRQGMKAILEAIDNVKSGISMWIFPEGTRNESEDISELMAFHEGSMKIAEKTGCPVIPVAITGTRDIYENHAPMVRAAKVTIEFGEPIILSELEPEKKKHSGAYTREVISQMLKNEQARRK